MATSTLYCPSCGALNTPDQQHCFACTHPLDESVHDVLLHNRYRLKEQVGKGGFGAVHKAADTQDHDAIVAIKQINLRGLMPQQVIEATDGFNREVSLLSHLSHPHLPHIYEHFTDPDHWYLVMDFIEGETLETYLEKSYTKRGTLTPLPLPEVLDIGLQLCSVLDYLHSREPAIIFRDIKPANIMRSSTGTLYLIDFGIARHFKPGKPKDTLPFGSPGYAAPEQYGKAQTTPRSDLYSLGALLHMLLSGNDPVDNPFHFDPLRIYGDAGVSELTQLIECMVTLDSEQRPQSARAVQEELQHVIDLQQPVHTQPVGATPPPPIVAQLIDSSNGGLGQRVQQMMVQRQQIRRQRQQYWSFNRRKSRRTFITTAAAIVGGVTIAGSGLGALIEFSRPEGIAISGTGQDSSIEGSGAGKDALFQIPYLLDSSFTDGFMVQALAWSPDGTRVALSAYKNVCIQTVDSANVASTYTGDVLALQEASDAIQTLAWRPKIADGIAFTSDSTLYLWSGAWSGKHGAPQASLLHTIQAQQPASVPLKALAWSPDGQSIAIPFSDGIQVWNASTRKLVKNLHLDHARMPATDKSTPLSLAWSPDGTYIAAALGDASPLFWRVSDGKMFTHNIDRVVAASMFARSPSEKFMALAAGTGIYIIA